MNKSLLSSISLTLIFLFSALAGQAQTTVSTGLTGASLSGTNGTNVFGVTNNNTYAIAITTISDYYNTVNNGRTYAVWYTTTQLTGAPNITTANGWTQLGSATITSTANNSVLPILTNQYLVVPPGTTMRIAVEVINGTSYSATSGTTSYTNGGVAIQTGSSTVSPGYGGAFPTPTTTPRYFAGSITFVQASVNNLAALSLLSPVAASANCSYDSVPVRVIIYNSGGSAQTNFPISARYTGTVGGNITTTYTNTLAPFTRDTVTIGKLNLGQGTYSVRAYTQLSTDTIPKNDTTAAVSFSFKKPLTVPVTKSDTVCPGGAGNVSILGVPNTQYKWYSAQTGGTLLNIGSALTFTNVTQDTVMWVASDSAGCASTRSMIQVKVTSPPTKELGNDTSFCESIPLLLDAGNPGAKYLWSTGDTDQTITVTNVSGAYWVRVTKYCDSYDTINVNILPQPFVGGISYVRTGNTYHFSATNVQNVLNYLWIFGDGATSTSPSPVHTYGSGINGALVVNLVVSNTCGDDTAKRTVPTGVNDIDADQYGVRLYPNPANNELTVHCDKATLEEAYLLNMTGSLVLRQPMSGNDARINIKELPAGNYILHLRTAAGELSRPVQIRR